MIDSGDIKRLEESKEEFDYCLELLELQKIPILILANKQDLDRTISEKEIDEAFHKSMDNSRVWRIQGCSVKKGEGCAEGMQWLLSNI
mmetsp:Transcript_43525/g.42005  ORF Transcript_43525/g.42005 Transcript_43525/m.42005 type:complete len:88 (+) Transcript_43525:268-531(+)